jgi:ABC-type sugar transport system substrate-binding protein
MEKLLMNGPIGLLGLRKILATAVVCAALLASFPAGAESAAQGKRIALLETSPTHPFIAALTKAMLDRAKSYGMEVTVFVNTFDPGLQSQQVDDAIARKFDLLAIMAASEQAIVPPLLRAKEAGVPVILVNTPAKDGTESLFVSFIGEDCTLMGKLSGESALAALKESGRPGGKIALITGSLQEGIGPRRVAGFREAVKANPKVEIVAVEDAKWDTALSERTAGQLYARFAASGGLDLVYGMADNQAVAAIKAAEAAKIVPGLGPGQMIVLGGNCLKDGIAMIKAGKEYSTGLQVPERTGVATADTIEAYFAKKPVPKMNYLPVETVSKATLDKWEGPCSY